MSNKLDFSDPSKLQTRDGREVRIYATDHIGSYPVTGAIKGDCGWEKASWTLGGENNIGVIRSCDLIPKPPRVTGWVNVYRTDLSPIPWGVFDTQQQAKAGAATGCIGQIYIDAEIQQ